VSGNYQEKVKKVKKGKKGKKGKDRLNVEDSQPSKALRGAARGRSRGQAVHRGARDQG
jgi:hypothetical protein